MYNEEVYKAQSDPAWLKITETLNIETCTDKIRRRHGAATRSPAWLEHDVYCCTVLRLYAVATVPFGNVWSRPRPRGSFMLKGC